MKKCLVVSLLFSLLLVGGAEVRRRVPRHARHEANRRLAAELGGKGEHVEDPADLVPALERAFASGAVYCVDVAIDPEAAAAAGAAGYAI